MKDYTDTYMELINPLYIRSLFKTDEQFIYWYMFQPLEDLQNFLKTFEIAEDYENCIIVRDAIHDIKIKSLMN